MTTTTRAEDSDATAPPSEIVLYPTRGDKQAAWRVQFADDVLSLVSADGHVVMMIPQEEAARHVRFRWEISRGSTVSFVVLQGLKAHTFRCPSHIRDRLLSWLPQKSVDERAREVRGHAAALVVFGLVQLYFGAMLFPVWGALLQAAGLIALLRPARAMHGLLGFVMLAAGLAILFSPQVFLSTDDDSLLRLAGTVSGSILLLWGIQQFSLLGANYQIRPVPRHDAGGDRDRSRLVIRVAVCAVAFSIAYGCYAIAIYWMIGTGDALSTDVMIFAALSVVSALAAGVLLLRRRPPYLEARITAQFLIIVAVLYASGIAAGFTSDEPFTFASDILTTGILRFDRPYIWAPLIMLLVLFQRWFLGRVERETEEDQSQ